MSQSMLAAVITEPGKADVREIPRPQYRDGEVLVRVTATGVCTFERRIFSGMQKHIPLPLIGGHEVAGVVEAAPENSGFQPGDPVALDLVYRCGECYYCTRGVDNQCVKIYSEGLKWHELFVIGGGFGQCLSVATKKVFKVAPNIPAPVVALTEPLADVIHSVNKANLRFGDHVAVVGAGTMGSLHVLVAQLLGCKVMVTDLDDARLAFARDQLGADAVVNPATEDAVAFAKDFSDGRGVNGVFVAAPSAKAGQQGLEMAGKYGTVVLYASTHPPAKLEVDWNHIHYKEIRLDGTEARNREDFRQATQILSKLNLAPLASKEIPISELPEELQRGVPAGETQRVIVNMDLPA